MTNQFEKGKPFPKSLTITVNSDKAVELGQQGLKAKQEQERKQKEEQHG